MTDLQAVPAIDSAPLHSSGGRPLPPHGDSSLIPAHEIDDLIASVNAELEELQAQVADAVAAGERASIDACHPAERWAQTSKVGELRDALVQVQLLGTVQMDRAMEAAHLHAAALVAEARAAAVDLVLQAQVDRAARLASLAVPPRGPVLAIQAPPPAPNPSGPAHGSPVGLTPLDPVEEEAEQLRFVEFWGAERATKEPEVDRRGDELAAIAIGIIGALVLILVALVWLG